MAIFAIARLGVGNKLTVLVAEVGNRAACIDPSPRNGRGAQDDMGPELGWRIGWITIC
jgi:hypothetical protein